MRRGSHTTMNATLTTPMPRIHARADDAKNHADLPQVDDIKAYAAGPLVGTVNLFPLNRHGWV